MSTSPFVLNIYKPCGISSAQVVASFKKIFPPSCYGKIGHLGTLDPFAEGVLLLGLARATRLTDYLHKWFPKKYWAKGMWGRQTNTGDCTGETLIQKDIAPLPPHWQLQLKKQFVEEYYQSPPPFSAAKHQGRPLYAYAREGKIIKKSPTLRKIYSIGDFNLIEGGLEFTCTVSGGTYIRVLFENMAQSLNQVGHLVQLIRTGVGPHRVEDALKEEEWGNLPAKEDIRIPLHQVIPLDSLYLGTREGKYYQQGQRVKFSPEAMISNPLRVNKEHLWVYGGEQNLLGLAKKGANGILEVGFNLPEI